MLDQGIKPVPSCPSFIEVSISTFKQDPPQQIGKKKPGNSFLANKHF
jgi:hypothetical protein